MIEKLLQENKAVRRKHDAKRLVDLNRKGAFRSLRGFTGSPDDPSKYEQVAQGLHDQLLARTATNRFANPGVQHGFTTTLRILKRGVDAYAAYHAEKKTEEEASVADLQEILWRSFRPAVTTFTDEPGNACKLLESAFGLTKSGPPHKPLPFIIELFEGEEERLVPSRSILARASLDIARRREDTQLYERCAARGRVHQGVWVAAIGTCAISEHLFPADIAAINAGSYELPA